MTKLRTLVVAATLAATFSAAPSAGAQMINLYVGLDTQDPITYGVYTGQANPNVGRLTLLYAHHYPYGRFNRNHYHPIGAYSYTGPVETPTSRDTSSGNAIPEVYTGLPGNALLPDTNSIWAGKLISQKTIEHYSDMRFRSVHSLATSGAGSSEHFMFNSSAGSRSAPMTGASIALELVSKSDGLNIADTNGAAILVNVSDRQVIGSGDDADFEYLPVFWVADTAAVGEYQAEFRLVDVNDSGRTPFLPSGRFILKFRVPETPTLGVERTVSLTLPLVTTGWELVAAPEASGPYTVIPFPEPPDTLHSQSGTTYTATLPVASDRQFYQLRRVAPPAP